MEAVPVRGLRAPFGAESGRPRSASGRGRVAGRATAGGSRRGRRLVGAGAAGAGGAIGVSSRRSDAGRDLASAAGFVTWVGVRRAGLAAAGRAAGGGVTSVFGACALARAALAGPPAATAGSTRVVTRRLPGAVGATA